MAKVYSTEITSEKITSDNPIHQRLFKAYVVAKDYVRGNFLEVGCGEGRGINTLLPLVHHYDAVDKLKDVLDDLKSQYPSVNFMSMNIPPLHGLKDNTYNSIVSFQVIEHIQNDVLFLTELHRILKPGGIALITTPNRKMSLSRNPWHVREYLAEELKALAGKIFSNVEMKGITGNAKVMKYYEDNKRSVQKITRWDIFNLQYHLPAAILRVPYEILNRWNRNKLQTHDSSLVSNIHHHDYLVTDHADDALDLLLIVHK